jgi:formylglycine-generating enzyme required for sulfatase activity
MGKYPITQAQYAAVMGMNPSYFKGAQRPVVGVTWDNCNEFCMRLSDLLGKECKLPSETQWEYACRAGTTTAYSFGDDVSQLETYAWYMKNSGQKTQTVGEKEPNALGLYDMHGNVWEWCEDRWHERYEGAPADGSAWISEGTPDAHVIRGGSWFNYFEVLRCAYRSWSDTTVGGSNVGFRLSMM